MNQRFKLIPAVYLILRRDNQVLLLRRANTGYADGQYSFVAGHLDGDETATQGLIREAKEEAGITITEDDILFAHVAHRLCRGEPNNERLDLFFECWNWEGEITNMESEKCDDLSWYDINEIPEKTLPYIRSIITDVLNKKMYSEHLTN